MEWNDRAKVDQVGISNCVRTGCYDDVVVIASSIPMSREDTTQVLRARSRRHPHRLARQERESVEELELTSQATLGDAELASVDKAMLAEEQRAYLRRPKVFGSTAQMEKG